MRCGGLPGVIDGSIPQHRASQLRGGEPQAQAVQGQRRGDDPTIRIRPHKQDEDKDADGFQAEPNEHGARRPVPRRDVGAAATEKNAPIAMAASTRPDNIVQRSNVLIRYSGNTKMMANSPIATAPAVILPHENVE